MVRLMASEFRIACACLCAKADIPEVQAIIRLLDPILQQELRAIAQDVYRTLLQRLAALSDSMGAADIDALVQAGPRRDRVLEAILLSLIAEIETNYSTIITGEARQRTIEAIDALFAFAASDVGFPQEAANLAVLRQAALNHLDILLRDSVVGQREAVRNLLEGYLTSAITRAPAAGALSAAAGDSGMSRAMFETALARILAPATTAALVVDAWAYLWQNIAAVEVATDAGVRAFEANAVRDARTTAFCRWVHGRIIPMSRARPQIEALTQAALRRDSAELLALWPFIDPEVARNGNELQFETFFRKAGLPPYHFRCRTTARPVQIRPA